MAVARRKMRSPLGAIPSCPFFVSYHESRSALVANSILVNFREGFHPPFLSFNSEFHELFLIIYYRNTILLVGRSMHVSQSRGDEFL